MNNLIQIEKQSASDPSILSVGQRAKGGAVAKAIDKRKASHASQNTILIINKSPSRILSGNKRGKSKQNKQKRSDKQHTLNNFLGQCESLQRLGVSSERPFDTQSLNNLHNRSEINIGEEGDDYIFDIVQKAKKGTNMFDSLSEKRDGDYVVGVKKN